MRPSLPIPSPSLSYWHRTTRAFPHLNENHQSNVPSSVPYIIIGSGIVGSLVAWELINSGVNGQDILILEAREAVSGASGRNAGHIRPDAFRGFPLFAAEHGPEQAIKIIANEKLHLQKAKEFVTKNNINCDFNYTTTVEACLSEEYANYMESTLESFKAAGGDASHIEVFRGPAAKTKTRHPQAVSAYEWPAGSNHPAKLTQWILSTVISRGVRLWTHCPATKVVKNPDTGESTTQSWHVHTTRGVATAKTVVHCTNAYAAFLLPHLEKFITSRSSQVHSFIPTSSLSSKDMLGGTMSLRYNRSNFFSVNQRIVDGTIIFGGSGTRSEAEAESIDRVTFDDSIFNETLVNNTKKEFLHLAKTTEELLRPGEGLDQAWTGIIGVTPDHVPLIGPIPGLEGQWICAGFNGHGMSRAFTCAPGLVKLINGNPWSSTGLPECFQYTETRIQKAVAQL